MTIPLEPLAAEVAHELAPLLVKDAENGDVGSHFIAVLTAPIETIAAAVTEDEDDRPGFSLFMDIETCPAEFLPWLLQIKGVRATPGLSEEDAREEGRKAEGLRRGTMTGPAGVGSMEKAAARHTASKDPALVRVIDRVGGDPYLTTVVTRTSDTPDPAQTLLDILSDKILGEIIVHVVTDEVLWEETTLVWDAVDPGVTWDTVVLADVT